MQNYEFEQNKQNIKSALQQGKKPRYKIYIALLLVAIAITAVIYMVQSGIIGTGKKITTKDDVSEAVSKLGSGLQNVSSTLDEIAGNIG